MASEPKAPTSTERLLPNWLQAYREYTADSESPEHFHLWVGLSTIAGAAQRKILMSASHFDVHSNMYVILVSPPGMARKTTALRIGKGFLRHVYGVNFSTESASAEAMVKMMCKITNPKHQSMTIFSAELASLMAVNPAAMTDFLTDIWDCNPDWDKQTIKHDLQRIKHPWMNLVAATTPSWLGQNLPASAIEGGFISRCIFVYSNDRILKSPFPELTDNQRELGHKLIHDLNIIGSLSGQFTFASDAYEFYDKWYRDTSRFPAVMDERTAGYFERKHVYVLKVAMALSLAQKNELVLEKRDIETALAILEGTEPGMHRAFSAVGKNRLSTDQERILSQVSHNGGMRYGEIIAANYHALSRREIDDILVNLTMMGRIRKGEGDKWIAVA